MRAPERPLPTARRTSLSSAMATAAVMEPSAQPLDRSLSKMMMRAEAGGDDETDMYAQYKLKQREHEFLKIQVGAGTSQGLPLRIAPIGNRCESD